MFLVVLSKDLKIKILTLCDKGGGILNFVTSHFKNSIKVIHLSSI